MRTKEIKLIAMDMDGTLLDGKKEISKASREAILEAVDRGISIAICSGRAPGDSSLYAAKAGLANCYILAYNGAYCLKAPHGEPYSQHTLEREAALAALAVLQEYGVSYACFLPEAIVSVQNELWPDHKTWTTHMEQPGAPMLRYGPQEAARLQGQGINKIICVDWENEARLEKIRQKLLPIQGLDITSSWSNNLELMPKGVNKGTALRELAERLGLSPEHVMAIGDFDNDIPMLQYAGCAIAMDNASETVKKIARHVTADNHREGVAQAIRRYAL